MGCLVTRFTGPVQIPTWTESFARVEQFVSDHVGRD